MACSRNGIDAAAGDLLERFNAPTQGTGHSKDVYKRQVSPLMRATAFINSMKSMQFAVKDTRELLDLPQLSQAKQEADLDGSGIRFRNVAFSYGGTGGAEVLHDLELHIPQGSFTALVAVSYTHLSRSPVSRR